MRMRRAVAILALLMLLLVALSGIAQAAVYVYKDGGAVVGTVYYTTSSLVKSENWAIDLDSQTQVYVEIFYENGSNGFKYGRVSGWEVVSQQNYNTADWAACKTTNVSSGRLRCDFKY